MPLMAWSDRYKTGVPEMDEQHEEMVGTLNQFHDLVQHNGDPALGRVLLEQLIRETRDHFAAEEDLMTRMHYPYFAEHYNRHRLLLQDLERCSREIQRDTIGPDSHILGYLRDWLMNHIQTHDRHYGKWLRERQVEMDEELPGVKAWDSELKLGWASTRAQVA